MRKEADTFRVKTTEGAAMPSRRSFLKALAAMPLLGRAMPALAAGSLLLSEARIYVDWGDLALLQGTAVPNRNDPRAPTRNLVAFPTGPILNESGSTLPARTNYYAAGPTGICDGATRIVTSSVNQVLYLYRSSTCPAIPRGVYGLRLRMRSTPGAGPFPVSFGLSTKYNTGTVADAEWYATIPFAAEFAYAGTGDIAIKFPLAGSDVLVDQIQLYAGGLNAIPPWGAEALTGGRRAFAFPGAMVADGNGNWAVAHGDAGAWIYEPDMAAHTYSEVTVMHIGSFDALPAESVAVGLSLPTDAMLGTTRDTSLSIGWEGTQPDYAGEVRMKPAKSYRSHSGINLLGTGVHVVGQVLTAAQSRMYFWEVPVYTEAGPFPLPLRANRWLVGSGSNTSRAWMPSSQAYGAHAATLVWDRALSQDEWQQAVAAVRVAYARRGLGAFAEFHLISGDSNATRATGDWTQILTSAGYLPGRNVWAANTSIGGQSTANLEGPAGRLAVTDGPILSAATAGGARALYHFVMGTNDWVTINAGVAPYVARVQALITQALAIHPKVSVMYHTIMPRTDAQASGANSTGQDFEPNRQASNAAMRAWIATQDPARVVLCDFGMNDTIGDRTQNAMLRIADGIHLSPRGDEDAAAICGAAIAGWRALVGL